MSDEDDVDDLLSALKSDDDESAGAERSDSDDDSDMDNSDQEDSSSVTDAEENMMSDDDDSMGGDGGITQAEVYDNLKRIGELEDEKQKIQDELRERTEQLRSMLKHIDRGSILYKMLQSALPGPAPKAAAAANPTKKSAPKAAAKKTAKKKRK